MLQEEIDTNSDLLRQFQFQISVATSERDQAVSRLASNIETSDKKITEFETKLKEVRTSFSYLDGVAYFIIYVPYN